MVPDDATLSAGGPPSSSWIQMPEQLLPPPDMTLRWRLIMLVHPIVQSKGPHIVDNAHEIVLEGTPQGHIKWSANIHYVRPLGSLELDTTIN